jgi:hypothetical protein
MSLVPQFIDNLVISVFVGHEKGGADWASVRILPARESVGVVILVEKLRNCIVKGDEDNLNFKIWFNVKKKLTCLCNLWNIR